jgi:hypothetical protein
VPLRCLHLPLVEEHCSRINYSSRHWQDNLHLNVVNKFLVPSRQNIIKTCLNWFMHPVARVSINKYRNLRVSSAGLRLRSDCSGKAQKQFNSQLQTRPLVREGATKQQSRSCLRKISWRRKNWSQVPDGRLTPGRTGRLTVGRKLTSASAFSNKCWCTV